METSSNIPSHYVGIGASAGGLEALQTLLSHLPVDTGACFVIVQHLSPDFKSLIAELLSKQTSMKVHNAQDEEQTKPNTIYVIPPKKSMMIAEGRLLLSDRNMDGNHHLPIDVFFRSLAEDQQHKSIGIILSGTGSDGSRGIKALKEVGGLVVAQEPASAKFDGMPLSALHTGIVDITLKPEYIGSHLQQYISHPLVKNEVSLLQTELQRDEKTLPEVFRVLKHHCDIDFGHYKPSTVARRIERRMTINHLTTLPEYLSLLIKNQREAEVLGKELLIGVTRFFRDETPFLNLKDKIIPDVFSTSESKTIRVWVSACSSGEEAYSIAILFAEYLAQHAVDRTVKIFATDVDSNAIAAAASGSFSEDIRHDIDPELLQRYFVHKNGRYNVTTDIRKMVIFATHNAISDPPFSNMDLVTCRNLLIYLQQPVQRKVISSFHFALRKNGYLFLGSSENLNELESYFEQIGEQKLRLFKKINNLRIPLSNSPIPLVNSVVNTSNGHFAPVSKVIDNYSQSRQRKTDNMPLEVLVQHFAPPSVLLDEHFNAQHVYGDVSKYFKCLPPGKVTININELIIDELNIAVSTALHRVRQTGENVFYQDVLNDTNKPASSLDLSVVQVTKLANSNYPVSQYWLTFEERAHHARIVRETVQFDKEAQAKQRIRDLEQELKQNKEHLQVTIEELETTNEELQSANEELMSANEELQSTNEELQSVNEELFTVNSEYQEKIEEISQANIDLDRTLKISNIGIIFLDSNLLIRRFTKQATQVINLVESDIGRPLHHISSPENYKDFISDVSKVAQTGDTINKEIRLASNHVVMVCISSDRQEHNNPNYSISITFNDISTLQSA